MATELILIRHGYTVRVHGDYVHAPLTPLGQQQAAQTGQYLFASQQPIDGFYTSPLRRAHETANIIASKINIQPTVKKGVREVEGLEIPALGLYEVASIFDPVEDYLDERAGKSIRWPIEGRIAASLLEIIAAHPEQRVVVVAHSGVISAVMAWYHRRTVSSSAADDTSVSSIRATGQCGEATSSPACCPSSSSTVLDRAENPDSLI